MVNDARGSVKGVHSSRSDILPFVVVALSIPVTYYPFSLYPFRVDYSFLFFSLDYVLIVLHVPT